MDRHVRWPEPINVETVEVKVLRITERDTTLRITLNGSDNKALLYEVIIPVGLSAKIQLDTNVVAMPILPSNMQLDDFTD